MQTFPPPTRHPRRLAALRHPATWISLLALLVAGAGTGYAAATVTGRDVVNGSLTGKDVKNGSLSAKDGDASLRGPAGPPGPGSTFTTVTVAELSAPEVTEFETTASCPPGASVVAGGHVFTPNTSGLAVARSYAVDPDTWLVRVVSGLPTQIQLTIVATCVS